MRWLGLSLALAVTASGVAVGCYSTGDGTSPPPKQIYFPVGLGVSRGGNVLYVANADFDLQWNGGTVQSYDLHLIRKSAVLTIQDPNNPNIGAVRPPSGVKCNTAIQEPPTYRTDESGQRQPLGETCAPPVDSSLYVRDSVTIGAFATDLQVWRKSLGRLLIPVRGDASLTWADIDVDDPNVAPPENASRSTDGSFAYGPFNIRCGAGQDGRCDASHHAGTDPNDNTRHITMPGEPFGMAQSDDGEIAAITHQTDTKTSLLSISDRPMLQFILEGVPTGGNGIVAIPHDPDAFNPGEVPSPAFLQTSRASAELALLRYYSDEGSGKQSSLRRPFLAKETTFTLTANAGGNDSRGIVIDPTPRIACKERAPAGDQEARKKCAQLPARVFFANRSPASMIVGEVGEPSASGDGTYDADRLTVFGNVPLSFGPSRLYLAPIVDANGNYALRVFIVCFDAASIFVFDPELGTLENIIRTGPGPFAMAFDPFDLKDAALHKRVEADPREPGLDLKRYRFAYIASFTQSYIQVLDLDNSRDKANPDTFERIVFTLGLPTVPRGSQ